MQGGYSVIAIGVVFVPVGLTLLLGGLGQVLGGEVTGMLLMLFSPIFLTIGVKLLSRSSRGRAKRIDVIANGEIGIATINVVEVDWMSRDFGWPPPYRIGFAFEVNGQSFWGERTTRNERTTSHKVGDRMWVLYDAGDPKRNVEWPPL